MKKKAAAAILPGMSLLAAGCAAQGVAAEKQPVQSTGVSAGAEAGNETGTEKGNQAGPDFQSQGETEAGTEKETEAGQRVIGKKSEGAYNIEFTNKTGNAVREFYIREARIEKSIEEAKK